MLAITAFNPKSPDAAPFPDVCLILNGNSERDTNGDWRKGGSDLQSIEKENRDGLSAFITRVGHFFVSDGERSRNGKRAAQ